MSNRFTEKAENALNRSLKLAEGLGHTYIGTEHILLALTEDGTSCSSQILKKHSLTSDRLLKIIKDNSGTGTKSTLTSRELTPRAKNVLENSYNHAIQYGNGIIGTEHILLSLLNEKDSVAVKLLTAAKINCNVVKEHVLILLREHERSFYRIKKEQNLPNIKQYGRNLCELAEQDKFDPVIGRDKETERLVRILCRKNKNNPCLIGEAGVGKTAIVEGLASRIVKGNVPDALKNKVIISVDLTSMIAGAKYRGDFEERIKNIILEVTKNKDIILFIDEIHSIVGAGAAEGAIDASNILKPQLARGDIQIIGATTFAEYSKYIKKDSALERRFQPITVEEPTPSETVNMLRGLKEKYESHHRVRIDNEAIDECVELSVKYICDRFLPDKAIDLLDEACVLTSVKSMNIQYSNIISRQICSELCNDIQDHEIGNLFFSTSDTRKLPFVTSESIKDTVSEICGIPSYLIKRKTDYSYMESELKRNIKGQDSAIEKVIKSLKRNDIGFGNNNSPRGIFMFCGESGTGKTALAIEISKTVSMDKDNLLRYDMSEFSEKQSISKLIGAPPGYVGHDEGGALTDAVRKKPYATVLFDEIEKADKDILNILLQISDYGYLTDSLGRHVSFKNSIIIMTTNIGATVKGLSGKIGFSEHNEESSSSMITENLRKHYSSEFINRFDEIIEFNRLDKNALSEIVKIKLSEIEKKLKNIDFSLEFDEDLPKMIAELSCKKELGVRSLLRNISGFFEIPIIELITESESSAHAVYLGLENGIPKVELKEPANV